MDRELTTEAATQLQQGVDLMLSRWAALRMAVANEWGGRDSLQKSQQFGHHLFHMLAQTREQLYVDDLEDVLEEFMLSLNTEIDDGSIEEIAEKLMVMREECLEGNFNSIKKLKETNAPSVSYVRQPGSNDGEDTEDSDSGGDNDTTMTEEDSSKMEVDAPQPQPSQEDRVADEPGQKHVPEEEDGWTVVASKRNRGRRN